MALFCGYWAYRLVDFFSLLGIFDSLPSPWPKSLISSNGTPIVFHGPPVMQHTLFLNGKSVSLDSINSELVETTQVYPSPRHKYTTLFHNHSLDWETMYLTPHIVTIDTNTRIFQYKILNIIHQQISIQNENSQLSPLYILSHIKRISRASFLLLRA